MKRGLVLAYGVVSYLTFLTVFLYLLGFTGGFVTPTRLDGESHGPASKSIVIDALLVLMFGLQHSVMARQGFKRWWTRIVPPPIERSTYVLTASLVLALLFWQWRPVGGVVWEISNPAARGITWVLFALGWLTVLFTTFLINHFDLFGLRQVWLYFRSRPYANLSFVAPGPYRLVRHPMYIGWLLAFWATPMMTVSHLLFAGAMTAYILIAIYLEERDLIAMHDQYADYRKRVPMLIPRPMFPQARINSHG